ncbi:MAG: cell wall-binding repeat-containing protein [Chloroflexota bacterium]|nr:cell wall-binding repeat-containing protein [Chloroflexota bacterium]
MLFGGSHLRCGVRLLLAVLLVVAGAALPPSPAQASSATVDRLWGSDRYATAAAISDAVFAPGVAVAFIATGTNFPDSLAGGPAAARRKAPILLTTQRDLPQATRSELTRLKPASIVILGGPGAVSEIVRTQLDAYTAGSVSRLAGADRFATAATISARHFAAGAPVAYVATGRSFPDALSAGAAAAAKGGPVLLVDTDAIPAAVRSELSRLRPARIVVVGGSAVVSDAVLVGLRAYTSGSVTRQSGADRFATAGAISAGAFSRASTVYLANGLGFADAVAGVPAAAMAGGPLLLATRTGLPSATFSELRRLDPPRVVLLGGDAALSGSLASAIRDATALTRVGPHIFRADGYTLQTVPAEMLAYNSANLVAIYGNRDASGAFIYKHTDGRWYDHPVGQAQYVVNMLRNYRIKPDQVYLDLAIANADRLLDRAVRHNGALFFPYPFDFGLHGRGTMNAPWYSGMAQGIALSGFVRLYELTRNDRWLQAAHETYASFKVPRQAGKPWFAVVENGNLWFEEYPWTPYDHTFNGHNFATYGLYDYWRLTGSAEAAQLTIGGITTAQRVSGTVRVAGGISQYCVAQSCLDRRVRNSAYHLTHIGQFIQLYRYTRNESFARLADTFTADNPNFRVGGTTVFKAGTHVGYRFDSNGSGSQDRSLTLASSSNAPYSQRTVPYGWIRPGNGIWFYISDGYFEGSWIRESSNAYARGFVDRLEYYWQRPLTVGSGTRTGYQYDGNGTITATKAATTASTTWHYSSRAKINGRAAVLLSSGPLAGYWLPIASSGTAGMSAAADELRSADAPSEPSEVSASTDAVPPPPPSQPEDPLIPPPMPGQQELGPVDGP